MSQLAILVDGDNVTVHNMTTGSTTGVTSTGTVTPPAPTPSPVTSAIDMMFRQAKGEPIPAGPSGWWNNPQTGVGEVREQIALVHGHHYTLDAGDVRKVYELTRPDSGPCEVAIHILSHGGTLTADLVGKTSGEVTGGAAFSVGASGAPPEPGAMEGQLTSLRFRREVPNAEYANLYLRIDGGDKVLLLAVNPT